MKTNFLRLIILLLGSTLMSQFLTVQSVKAENYGATITVDAPREVSVAELISNPYPSTVNNVLSRIRVKNGQKIMINVGSVAGFQNITDLYSGNLTPDGKKVEISEAGSASFVYTIHGTDGSQQQQYRVVMHVNYYGMLQFGGADSPATLDVTSSNEDELLSVPAGKFDAIGWFGSGSEEIGSSESMSLKNLLATGHTSFLAKFGDGTSNALADGTPGGYSDYSITLVDKRAPVTPRHQVNFSKTGNGSLTATVEGTPISDGEMVEKGKTVIFTANPASGWRIKEWNPGNGTSTSLSKVVTAPVTVSVTFEQIPTPPVTPKHQVNFSKTGNGSLTATVEGTPISSGDLVEEGKTVIFTANPASGWRIKEWNPGNGTSTSLSKVVNAPVTVSVTFEQIPTPPVTPKHQVNFSKTGNGSLIVTVDGTPISDGDLVQEGKTVVFTANPASGWRIKSWNPGNGTSTTLSKVVTAPVTVSVIFEQIPTPPVTPRHQVNFSKTGNGSLTATVEGTPISSGDLVEEGKTVIFTANPASGWRIKEWNPGNGTSTSLSKVVTAPVTVSVTFEQIPTPPVAPKHAVNFSKTGNGSLTATVEGTPISSGDLVEEGKIVKITTTPASGWELKNLKIKTASGKELTISQDSSFTMPNEAVAVSIKFGTVSNQDIPGFEAYASGEIVYLSLPARETIRIYSLSGVLIGVYPLSEGAHTLLPSQKGVLILQGSTGWSRKVILR